MSEITDILSGSVDLRRNTAFVVDNVDVAASVAIDRQPRKAAKMEIEVIGATVTTGVVNIAGSTTETLNFTENGVQVGELDFSSLTGLTMSGITDGFIQMRALNSMGQPINDEIDVEIGMAVKFFAQKGRIKMKKAGKEQVADYKMITAPDKDVRDNDLVYAVSGVIGITFGQVVFAEKIFDFDGATHHLEAEVMDL